MENRRIFYLCRHFGRPVGGVRTAYRHVEILRRHGFDATILLTASKGESYFEADVPVLRFEPRMSFNMSDILVIPEGWDWFIKPFGASGLRANVFCQNPFYIFDGLGDAPNYEALGISRVFCSSSFIATTLKELLGYEDLPVVPYAIDPAVFKPGRKSLQIAYMPRKMPDEAAFIIGMFKRLHRKHADVDWVKIQDVNEAEAAEILGQSAVFLSFSRLEGLGLPPLEAMSSGCLTVGFLGDAGREFATPENGLWCEADDWHGVADALAKAVDMLETAAGERMIESGRQTAAGYSIETMESALINFWTAEMQRPD